MLKMKVERKMQIERFNKLLVPIFLWSLWACVSSSDSNYKFPTGVYQLSEVDFVSKTEPKSLGISIGSSRIVGLGESIHTSSGFYAYKSRIIQFLIEKKKFRHLGLETSADANNKIRSYVLSKFDDPYQILKELSPIFNDQNVLELLKWIRKWNFNNPNDVVEVFGFDNEANDWASRESYMEEYIKEYLTKHFNGKLIIWSHNGHLSKSVFPSGPGTPFGKEMYHSFGKDYFPIAFIANKTGYHFIGDENQKWHTSNSKSFEEELSKLSTSPLFIDLIKYNESIERQFSLSVSPPVSVSPSFKYFSGVLFLSESVPLRRVIIHPDES